MAKSKYFYDYPNQREIAKDLLSDDRHMLSEKTGLTYDYVKKWCEGKRRNKGIMKLALQFAEINRRTILRKKKIEYKKESELS